MNRTWCLFFLATLLGMAHDGNRFLQYDVVNALMDTEVSQGSMGAQRKRLKPVIRGNLLEEGMAVKRKIISHNSE